MSRAFIKEDAGDGGGEELPARPESLGPNYVTPAGQKALEAELRRLEALIAAIPLMTEDLEAKKRRARLERDHRYFQRRVESAVVVDNSETPPAEVRFGARVEGVDEAGAAHCFSIVGEDEADAAQGRISWSSPLAGALLGLKVGDRAVWPRPDGELRLTLKSISY
ncbi:MAG TPA: transcription elongation factor GreAB [Elusimicrobia bacterium]|nr:transcription elongation factor GreAB [Elusimicrobiota bacterium]